MCKSQIIESLLKKIFQTVERILANSETITSPSFYLLTPSGMETLVDEIAAEMKGEIAE